MHQEQTNVSSNPKEKIKKKGKIWMKSTLLKMKKKKIKMAWIAGYIPFKFGEQTLHF